MPSTLESKIINAPIDQVWKKFSNFHDMPWAANVLSTCEKAGPVDGDKAGAKRILNGAFQETQTELNPDTHTLKYSIDDGPSPVSKNEVSNYVGTVQLSTAPGSNGTLVEWGATWNSNSDEAVAFCAGIYTALLNELAESFA
jgi:hypothetical protein